MLFRLSGLMFFFIPMGMLVALALYQRIVNLSVRLPLPGVIPKRLLLTDPENDLVVGLSAWYAIYSYPQCFHDHIVVLFRMVRRLELVTISTISTPAWHQGIPGVA